MLVNTIFGTSVGRTQEQCGDYLTELIIRRSQVQILAVIAKTSSAVLPHRPDVVEVFLTDAIELATNAICAT
jgi:hypothetical protein